MSQEDKTLFKFALNGEDYVVAKQIADKNGFGKVMDNIRTYLDDVEKRAKEAGFKLGHMENFFPRNVKDKEGLMNYLESNGIIERAIKEESSKLGKELNADEQSKLISSIMRGFNANDKIFITSGNIKSRAVDYTADLDQFYSEPVEALSKYINDMENMIEAGELFKGKIKNLEDGTVDWSETIGNYVKDMNLSPLKQQELKELLTARFSYVGTQGFARTIKDATYLINLNNVLNTITQAGDLGFSLYSNGLVDTIKGAVASISGKGIKASDIGIDMPLAELESGTALSKALNFVFKTTFFKNMDKFGKETLMNATVKRYSNQAKKYLETGKETDDIKFIREIFGDKPTTMNGAIKQGVVGDKADDVIEQLAKGEINDDTRFLAFNKLSDFQPITLSEVPEQYLRHPNGRIFYALKTFQIKQLDVFRREVFQEIKKGNIAKGTKNLVSLVAVLTAMNMGTDAIKDIIQGKEIKLEDSAVDNLLSLGGLNRYLLESAYGRGVGQAAINFVAPPIFNNLNNIGLDIKDSIEGKIEDPKNLRSVQYFPWVGRIFYNREGRGSESKLTKSSGNIKLPTKKIKKKLKIKL